MVGRKYLDEHLSKEAAMSRVQLALRVGDLAGSIEFYSKLFATEPAKVRPGYANFAVTEPPLKLVLLEGVPGQETVLDHLGVEVESSEQVDAASRRLTGEGMDTLEETGTCCYACRTRSGYTAPARSRGRSIPSRPTRRPTARAARRSRRRTAAHPPEHGRAKNHARRETRNGP
jgi:catechol 2,3-dioxygenase-like lactoylglutathione lyase family enzyme